MTLAQHLATGATTVCRCWAVTRRDAVVLGFTDHDCDLTFDGVHFRAGSGLSAGALVQSTGLSVDNSEAIGALSDAAVTEDDLQAGRYDGAEVRLWWVNWQDVQDRKMQFRGTIGEVTRGGGQFRAELRGLTEALNRPARRVFQRGCSAVLGDDRCKIGLDDPAWSHETALIGLSDRSGIRTAALSFAAGWFEGGSVTFLDGAARGISVPIRSDQDQGDERSLSLWHDPGVMPDVGDRVRLRAGCDRSMDTCRAKFGNFLNFRGFPDIPGDDWLTSVPARAGNKNGSSRNSS